MRDAVGPRGEAGEGEGEVGAGARREVSDKLSYELLRPRRRLGICVPCSLCRVHRYVTVL